MSSDVGFAVGKRMDRFDGSRAVTVMTVVVRTRSSFMMVRRWVDGSMQFF